jgi:hypothetical protein
MAGGPAPKKPWDGIVGHDKNDPRPKKKHLAGKAGHDMNHPPPKTVTKTLAKNVAPNKWL